MRNFTLSLSSITNSKVGCTNSPRSTTLSEPEQRRRNHPQEAKTAVEGPDGRYLCGAIARLRPRRTADCVSTRPDCRSSAVRCDSRSSRAPRLRGPRDALSVALALFFAFFFRDPERIVSGVRASVLSPADGRVLVAGPAAAAGAPARRVAADQHLPLADGRAHQSHPGVGTRHRGSATRRGSSCRRIVTTPDRRTSAARSGSTTAGRRSWRGRSSGFSPAASSAASRRARTCARRRSLRRHEIRIADGRLPAGDRDDCRRRGRCVRGGETVIAVLH